MKEQRWSQRKQKVQGLHGGSMAFSRDSEKSSVARAVKAEDKAQNVSRYHTREGTGSSPDGQPVCTSVAMLSLGQCLASVPVDEELLR